MNPVELVFIGPFPPELHGQSHSTLCLYKKLQSSGINIKAIDTNGGVSPPLQRSVLRVARHFKAIGFLIWMRAPVTYISVNSNAGMFLTLLLAFTASLLRSRILLHHHTYGHLKYYRSIMGLIIRLTSITDVHHICICDDMSAALKSRYGAGLNTSSISNVDAVDSELRSLHVSSGPFKIDTVGHLSNLSEDKGILRVMKTFKVALKKNLVKKLIVAGPANDAVSRAAVENMRLEFGARFEYRGSVKNDEKLAFFSDIDLFLFPSLYENETQGIVNLEALAAGVPVVAFGLCCIPSDLKEPVCKVVAVGDSFIDSCCEYIEEASSSNIDYPQAARQLFDNLMNDNSNRHLSLLELIRS